MQTIIYIFPELFLSFSIMTLLMIGVFLKKSYKLINILTITSLIFTTALVLNQQDETIKIFNNSYIVDNLSNLMKVITLLFCIFVSMIAYENNETMKLTATIVKFKTPNIPLGTPNIPLDASNMYP